MYEKIKSQLTEALNQVSYAERAEDGYYGPGQAINHLEEAGDCLAVALRQIERKVQELKP